MLHGKHVGLVRVRFRVSLSWLMMCDAPTTVSVHHNFTATWNHRKNLLNYATHSIILLDRSIIDYLTKMYR